MRKAKNIYRALPAQKLGIGRSSVSENQDRGQAKKKSTGDPWVAQRFGACLWPGPSAQGMILETRDRVPHQAPCTEPASPSACVSASLSLSLMNK